MGEPLASQFIAYAHSFNIYNPDHTSSHLCATSYDALQALTLDSRRESHSDCFEP